MTKRTCILLMLLLVVSLGTLPVQAQLRNVVKEILSNATKDSVVASNALTDSSASSRMEQKLLLAKENEMSLRMELEQMKLKVAGVDSIKIAKLKVRIDSLRTVTLGVPVVVDEDTLFSVYAKRGGLTPHERAATFSANITQLGERYNLHPDSVYLDSTDLVTDIMYKDKVLVSCTDLDGLWENISRQKLAESYRTILVDKLTQLKEEHSTFRLLKRGALFLLVLVVQALLYWLTSYFYRKLKVKILGLKETRLKAIKIHDYELFDTERQVRILTFLANMGRYLVIILQLLITVPILFAIFPQTEYLALKIFSYLWDPTKAILKGIVSYIPNLFTIFVISFSVRYVIKGLKYLSLEIKTERLKITGFYPDWAQPTYHLIRFLLYAFMIAMIYPYLPGADTGVFQGISVFVGLIVSLGSSTVIANIMAGMVLTYMRSFQIEDRISLDDKTGNVIEKTPFVTRIRTPKNEIITIPNASIMSSHITNYSSSARTYGLIIHSEVTIGYDAPWRQVHQLLIDAARATPGVSPEPIPFVLETSLSDFYPVYQVNAYIQDANKLAQIYSDLHQNIQDKFNEAGVEIMSPHYTAYRDGNETTIPKK